MMVSAKLRREVVQRAKNRCEYCGLSQEGQEAIFHVDHIIPVSANGQSTLDNLALACVSCSLRKGARQSAPDLETGLETRLFNPRTDLWKGHFAWDEMKISGLTPTGRATTFALNLNRPMALAIRREEQLRNRHPG